MRSPSVKSHLIATSLSLALLGTAPLDARAQDGVVAPGAAQEDLRMKSWKW